MIVCDKCGKKYVSQAKLDAHIEKVHPVVEEPKEAKPVDTNVVLKFTKAIEVTINGKRYAGQEIKAPDIEIASEIVRIAREAYGKDILFL